MANKKDVLVVPFPYDDPEKQRVETGPVQFGNDDWPGMFIRGDEVFYISVLFDELLNRNPPRHLVDQLTDTVAKGWAKTLRSAYVNKPITPPPFYLDKLADMLFKEVPEDQLVWKEGTTTFTAKEVRQKIAAHESFGYEFLDALLTLARHLLQEGSTVG